MEKVAAYLRVSTESQVGENRFGLLAQKEQILTYAKQNGFQVIKWYSDEGISGAILEREGLQSLIEDSRKGCFLAVLVAKMDRIARDLMFQLWIEKELLKNKVEIISAVEPFRGQDPTAILFRQIIGSFAQFEKARISERMEGGRRQKAKKGGYSGGGAPLGYKTMRGQKSLYIDKEKALTVKRVFGLKEENPQISLQSIADKLNFEGFTTAQGKQFSKVQVKRILDRKILYSGGYKYGDITVSCGQQQAII